MSIWRLCVLSTSAHHPRTCGTHRFTLAIKQKPTLYAYEKRCAALAHVGRYAIAWGGGSMWGSSTGESRACDERYTHTRPVVDVLLHVCHCALS